MPGALRPAQGSLRPTETSECRPSRGDSPLRRDHTEDPDLEARGGEAAGRPAASLCGRGLPCPWTGDVSPGAGECGPATWGRHPPPPLRYTTPLDTVLPPHFLLSSAARPLLPALLPRELASQHWRAEDEAVNMNDRATPLELPSHT
ncbi:hypothetical protein NDU88_003130 [Pleurodeles waltl]|uniref:Uncharacterized protein n=1 Tax=Pleurodeles waltl TaxID=8319 RepID=A0AAV7W192_PLEWA|nr:hypothetical protein NDU88_003130 [Pleurodeles waltl]